VGGSPGFDSLAIFNLNLPHVPAEEVSFESEWKAFLDFGREISLRPFIGVRKMTEKDVAPSGHDSFKRNLIVGIVFFKWF
jgi:hypothetical protein